MGKSIYNLRKTAPLYFLDFKFIEFNTIYMDTDNPKKSKPFYW